MSIDVPVTTQLIGQEQVSAGFQRMGQSSSQMSMQVQANNRMMMTSMAALGMQSLNMSRLFERMAKGEVDAGEAIVQLGAYALTTTSYIMALNMANTKRIALQGASAAASVREAAANAAATASSWLKTAALRAEGIAQGIKQALSGPAGWAILAGAAAATAGVLALTGNIPKMANGGVVNSPTLAVIGEAGPEAVVPLNKGFGNTTINVTVNGAGNYEEARRGAYTGTNEALQLNYLRRKSEAS